MGKLGCICCVLCSVLIITVQGQYQGSHYFPYGPYGGTTRPRQQGQGAGDHIGRGQHPGTGHGYYPQFPPPERPISRPRPKPPKPASPPVVTPHPIAPTVPPRPATTIPPSVAPVNPVIPIRPNPVPTGVAGIPSHHTLRPVTEEFQPIIPVTPRRRLPPRRTPYLPRPYPRFTLAPSPCSPNLNNQCSNRGTCITNPIRNTPKCHCRDLYAGERCEIVLKPPRNITMVDVAPTHVSISWVPPPVELKYITGFIVQYNKFGSQETIFTPHIHPGVSDYTLRDLEPESQYTICINIIFKNVTAREAVLRDQCLEIRTQPDEFQSGGISLTFMALIVGAVVLVLVLIMVMALLIQRRCLKPIREPIQRTIHRAMSRRSVMVHRPHHKHNANHHNHLPRQPAASSVAAAGRCDQEAEACVKVHRMPPATQRSNPFFARLQTNNANNSDYKDWALPVSVNYSRLQVPDVQPPKYTRSTSCSISRAPPPPRSTTSRHQTELSTFGHHRKNQDLRSSRSVPPHATIRALPPSVSNHMIRSKNAREKDASNEFDVRGTYMYFSAPGQNLTQ